ISQGSLAATGNYTIGTFHDGTLTVSLPPQAATDVLNTIASGALTASGNAVDKVLGGLYVAASSTGAVSATGTSSSNVGTYPITEGSLAATGNYTIGTFHGGTLTVSLPPQAADYILNTTASGALTASGNAVVKVPGGLYVASSSTSAVSASG